MKAGSRQVLLLFKKGGSRDTPSPHDGDGELHLPFAITAADQANWEASLGNVSCDLNNKETAGDDCV
jgi:hypothetical protein